MFHGKEETLAYCMQHKHRLNLHPSDTCFRFRDGSYQSLGQMTLRAPTPSGSFVQRSFDVVSADVLMIIELYMLDEEVLVANNVESQLKCPEFHWKITIVRNLGHMFLC